jgi:hypothetical protein
MHQRISHASSLILALATVVALFPGCKKGASAGQDTQVELSDVRLVVLGPEKFRLGIKYRFVQGKPLEHTPCACMATIRHGKKNHGGLAFLYRGTQDELQPEGNFEQEFAIVPPIQVGDSVSCEIQIKEGQGYSKAISNVLTVTSKWE